MTCSRAAKESLPLNDHCHDCFHCCKSRMMVWSTSAAGLMASNGLTAASAKEVNGNVVLSPAWLTLAVDSVLWVLPLYESVAYPAAI